MDQYILWNKRTKHPWSLFPCFLSWELWKDLLRKMVVLTTKTGMWAFISDSCVRKYQLIRLYRLTQKTSTDMSVNLPKTLLCTFNCLFYLLQQWLQRLVWCIEECSAVTIPDDHYTKVVSAMFSNLKVKCVFWTSLVYYLCNQWKDTGTDWGAWSFWRYLSICCRVTR